MASRPFVPSIPTRTGIIPTGPAWVREIKFDGFRMIVRRDGDRVRLLTRNGHDWSEKYPAITEAARRLKPTSIVLDGEAVVLDPNGLADFDRLMSRKHDGEVKLLAFDLLAVEDKDIRGEQVACQEAPAGQAAGDVAGRHPTPRVMEAFG
jgi:bifunctional non-homologous end joining protein LigD